MTARSALPPILILFAASVSACGVAQAAPDFQALVERHAPRAVEDRRYLHAHPELSLRELETQRFLRDALLEIPGIELVDGDWGTGLVAILPGRNARPLVAYRADMDALPMTEATGLPYASTRTDTLGGGTVGVMHACGHDIHMTVLLGAARVLSEARSEMAGTALFILQPAEEIGAGAASMIAAGIFDGDRRPDAIFALHDQPAVLCGQVGYRPGRSSANVDDFKIRVLGRGGHGAYPHRAIDPVVIAAETILALQTVVSREIDAARQAVVTVAAVHGGTSSNVIPEEVELRGTARSLEPDVREQIKTAVIRTVRGIAAAHGAPEPEVLYSFGTPSGYNNPALVDETLPTIIRVMGQENVILAESGMGGEDFAYFQAEIPGFMFRLGVGRPDRTMAVHNPAFDPDESAIPIGIRLVSEILWDYMARHAE